MEFKLSQENKSSNLGANPLKLYDVLHGGYLYVALQCPGAIHDQEAKLVVVEGDVAQVEHRGDAVEDVLDLWLINGRVGVNC